VGEGTGGVSLETKYLHLRADSGDVNNRFRGDVNNF
jgi:hypothetical protein